MSDRDPENFLGFHPDSIRKEVAPEAHPTESDAPTTAAEEEVPRAGKSQATEIVEMALEEFQLRVNPDGEAFVVTERLPHVASQLRGGKLSLRQLLAAEYFDRYGRVPSNAGLADAISVLEGKAQRLEPVQTHLRVAHREGAVFIDLGDAEGHVVRVDASGWSVEPTAPVIFRRTEVGQAMPIPIRGGELDALWTLCNIDPAEQPLVLSWLLATFMPDAACPILVLVGEQGSAKSTSARVLASIVDPCMPQLRRPPVSDVDWPAVAQVSRVVALDNMSHVPDRLSDPLCRAVTGDGDVRRRLYSDGNVVPFAFKRAILLNGISLGSLRGDLAERTLTCTLGVITPEQRKLDAEVNSTLATQLPALTGAIFDLLSQALKVLPTLELPSKPRMSDFAVLLAAVDEVLGTNGLEQYLTQLQSRAVDTIDGDNVLTALRSETEVEWSGTASELLAKITFYAPDGHDRKYWPGTPQKLAQYLTRRAPAMRAAGWTVIQGYDSHRKVSRWTLVPPEDQLEGDHQVNTSP